MSFSKQVRYRNIATTEEYPRGGSSRPVGLILIVAAVVLIVCCGCLGLLIGLQLGGGMTTLTSNIPGFGGPTATPTPDFKSPVSLKKPGLAENGMELTVVGVQRPLQVQGNVKLPPDQQFVLVTVHIRNTKKTGTPILVKAADFTVRGDGGLTYDPNPKTVTIPQMLTEANIAPNKDVDGELIFQIATDDTGLKLSWKVGNATRVFLLEETK